MSSATSFGPGTPKTKKSVNVPPRVRGGGPSDPTTFFLRTERELEEGAQRGRGKARSRTSTGSGNAGPGLPSGNMAGDNSFGVESLEDTIGSIHVPEESLSRPSSTSSRLSEHTQPEPPATKKRPSVNRVQPSIIATGQRILSSDRHISLASPIVTDHSPSEQSTRSGSDTSLVNMSQLLTPARLSPHPASAVSSEPRSGSPKSFRLSDEEGSLADETHSQAILSSSGDDEEQGLQMNRTHHQLVMPSLSMPIRWPFTDTGRRIGRAKILVIGPRRVGKTSFIRSLVRTCEHIVHTDQPPLGTPSQSSSATESSRYVPTTSFTEIQASTRPYPTWWTDPEHRGLSQRRSSVGNGILDRNLTLIDSPGIEQDSQVRLVLNYMKASFSRTVHMDSMDNAELINLLSGDGGVQINAVVYIFDPLLATPCSTSLLGLTGAHEELLVYLSKWTNLIPVVGRADAVSDEMLRSRTEQVRRGLQDLGIESYPIANREGSDQVEPLAVSSAIEDDTEEVDASVLMSSQYLKPLVASDLGRLVDGLLSPDNIARLRHLSAAKFLLWRQQQLDHHVHTPERVQLPTSHFSQAPNSGSLSHEPSQVLVPHSRSSFYRPSSPAISDVSGPSGDVLNTSAWALARSHEQIQNNMPFRQVRLAKWAQDLQRNLEHECRRCHDFHIAQRADWTSDDEEKTEQALIFLRAGTCAPPGQLRGDHGVVDPRDPLGILALGQAFRRRGFFALQVAGSCGLLGAMAYCVTKHWSEIQTFLGLRAPPSTFAAVPPPADTRLVLSSWFGDSHDVRDFFGWRS